MNITSCSSAAGLKNRSLQVRRAGMLFMYRLRVLLKGIGCNWQWIFTLCTKKPPTSEIISLKTWRWGSTEKLNSFQTLFFFFPGKKYFPLFLNSLVSFISHFKYYFAVISTGNLKANWLCWVSVFLYSCMNKEFKACLVASCTPFSLVCPTRAAKLCCIACV